MKQSSIVLFFAVLVLAGCGKEEEGEVINKGDGDTGLAGKWRYSEQFYSAGPPGSWTPVQPANQYIEFKDDGTFVSVPGFVSGANRYEIVDSITVKISPANTANGFITYQYQVSETGDQLILSPSDPICIEGCASKFVR